MMMDQLMVADIQKEISEIQEELKNRSNGNDGAVVDIKPLFDPDTLFYEDKVQFQPTTDNINETNDNKTNTFNKFSLTAREPVILLDRDAVAKHVKNEIKTETCPMPVPVDLLLEEEAKGRRSNSDSLLSSMLLTPEQEAIFDVTHIEHITPKEDDSRSDTTSSSNSTYDEIASPKQSNSRYDSKRELENLDIESEITPSYIIKKCEQPVRDPSPVSSTDFPMDYLCSPTNGNQMNRKKDDLLACDKEPYDEWLCIQKELNLITEKRSEPENDNEIIGGYMDSTMVAKLNVDTQFQDLFNHRTNHDLNEKSDIGDGHSPLSELFNDSIVSNTCDNVEKSVENRLENMFSDSSEFEKTNDLVESRLEELFHGSSTPPLVSSQPMTNQAFHHHTQQQHIQNAATDFNNMMQNQHDHQNMHVQMQQQQQHSGILSMQNKRQWHNNSDLISSVSPNALHPSKRSCMISSYVETTNNSVDQRWMMDVQVHQTSTYDFLTSDNPLENDNTKRLWNGASDDTSALDSVDNMLMNSIDHKKQCFNMSVKDDLERDLLGLSASSSPSPIDNNHSILLNIPQNHISNDTSFDTSTIPGSSGTANTSNNSITSTFDEDINRHVQNAIDSILNLQNTETESLHYLDHSINSFMPDSPLAPTYSNNSTLGSSMSNRGQHNIQTNIHHHHQYSGGSSGGSGLPTHKRRMNHYDDTTDCLISGGRTMSDGNVDMMDSPPILQQTNSGLSNITGNSTGVTDFIGMDDQVKSIMSS